MASSSDTLLLGTRKGMLTFTRGSNSWEMSKLDFAGQPVSYAHRDTRNGTLWAALDHGHWGQKLHRSKDNGETWEEITAPAYPEGSEIKDGVPATLRYLWVMAEGGKDEPNRMYIGTEPGGLFRSDNGGDSFELVESLWNHPSRKQWMGGGRDEAGIHSVIVDPRDSRHVLIGVSCAGVFETTDDGATWTHRNKGLKADFFPDPDIEIGHDPHFVDYCQSDPNYMWMQNHCGIFKTENGGMLWERVSQEGGPAHFGFAVAADERDPNTAWVVPADSDGKRMAPSGKVCVSRTEDGGKTWQALTNGLPQENAFDIVFRHALDNSGNRLAFGSTTGNLYVSEDRGDHWNCVGNHFPPVYSVRFA